MAGAFWPVNSRIHENPELGFKERIAHDALAGFMQTRKGWDMMKGAYGDGGKIQLLKAGTHLGHKVDLSLMSHPETFPDSALMHTTANHGSRLSTLAVKLMRLLTPGSVSTRLMLSRQLAPTSQSRDSKLLLMILCRDILRILWLSSAVEACFQAGALATGAKLPITPRGGYKDHIPNRVFARSYTRYFNAPWIGSYLQKPAQPGY
ncbi:Fc.00g032860.m01.CDS01 [Cosmosporella sp. VM-42]